MAAFKRFYKNVTVGEGFEVLLDSKPVKTPGRNDLVLPTSVLADLISKEWAAQRGAIKPATMPLTRLANTALDTTSRHRETIIGEILAYAGHDLVCYRADMPPALLAAEQAAWDPYLEWLENACQVRLKITTGIATVTQDNKALEDLEEMLEHMENFGLTALHNATTLTGSLVLALALMKGFRTQDEIWAAANIDEDFQIAEWGEDEEAKAARVAKAGVWFAVASFIEALK